MDFAFWFFIAGAMLSLVGLIAFTIVAAAGGRGRHRLFAAVPAATLVGQLTLSVGGGVLIMAAWLAAAAMDLGRLRRTAAVSLYRQDPSPAIPKHRASSAVSPSKRTAHA